MIIESPYRFASFASLKRGVVFIWNGYYYIKYSGKAAIYLSNGFPVSVEDNPSVFVVKKTFKSKSFGQGPMISYDKLSVGRCFSLPPSEDLYLKIDNHIFVSSNKTVNLTGNILDIPCLNPHDLVCEEEVTLVCEH